MAATAVIATTIAAATAAQVESAAQQRRLAGQAKNRQEDEIRVANEKRAEAEKQESNRAFSKIQRQRQRALAAGAVAQSTGNTGGGSIISGGAGSLSPTAPASGPGTYKTTLGS